MLRLLYVNSIVDSMMIRFFFFFKQKTAYEMRISDWSSDVCSSDLVIADQAVGIGQLERQPQNSGHRTQGNVALAPVQQDAQSLYPIDLLPAHHTCIEIGRASCRERVCQYV